MIIEDEILDRSRRASALAGALVLAGSLVLALSVALTWAFARRDANAFALREWSLRTTLAFDRSDLMAPDLELRLRQRIDALPAMWARRADGTRMPADAAESSSGPLHALALLRSMQASAAARGELFSVLGELAS